MATDQQPRMNEISVVIPVYSGEHTIAGVVDELVALTTPRLSSGGRLYVVKDVALVHDNGPDRSDEVIRELSEQYPGVVRGVWLSRNFGQHAATLAGMREARSEWVVTMDEDGEHDPRFIGDLLDAAVVARTQVAYGDPHSDEPSGGVRATTSRGAKFVLARVLGNAEAPKYQSFRLIEGDLARAVATSIGHGAFLDVALGWLARSPVNVPISLRNQGRRPSTYTWRSLLRHFRGLVMTTGVQGLRAVTWLGVLSAAVGVLATLWIVVYGLATGWYPEGWASTYVTYLLGNGAVLLSVGIVAEYVGVLLSRAYGRPTYFVTTDPADGPLGQP